MNRFLVITENDTFINNMKEWFDYDIKNGLLEIDFARNKEEAKEFVKKKNYDKIFHNGIYVIDLIEQYQSNADVIKQGLTKNKIFNKTISGTSKEEILNLDINKDRPFYLKVSYGLLGVFLMALVSFVIYIDTIRNDVDINTEKIVIIEKKVDDIKDNLNAIDKKISSLLFYFDKQKKK